MKTIYADSEHMRELLKDTEKQPILIQGPDDLAGILLSVETYELLGRYDDALLSTREDEEDEARASEVRSYVTFASLTRDQLGHTRLHPFNYGDRSQRRCRNRTRASRQTSLAYASRRRK